MALPTKRVCVLALMTVFARRLGTVTGQATTARRHGLKTPTNNFAGASLYGWLVSPYTAKVRSMLHHKGITFSDTTPTATQLLTRVRPAVGRLIMPAVHLSDGSWRQDSALICDEIEAEHPEPNLRPSGAAQQLASSLLELHADEWLPLLALHYRWAHNEAWAVDEFARCGFPLLPGSLGAQLVRPVASKMKSIRRVQGAAPGTHAGIEAYAASLISHLEEHLRSSGLPFLLGGRPCRGDFALYGPLWSHLFRDPSSRPLYEEATHVVAWFERLHGHAADAAFPNLPCRVPPSHAANDADATAAFLPADEVPESLDGLFKGVFAEQWDFLARLSQQLDAHLDEQQQQQQQAATASGSGDAGSGGGGGTRLRVPRALGTLPFTVGGAAGERRAVIYQLWRMQRSLDAFAALELAPSRDLELRSAQAWLSRLGALDAFRAVKPRWRLERDSKLPIAQETFHATRVR